MSSRWSLRAALAVLVLTLSVPFVGMQPAGADGTLSFTYHIETKGTVRSDLLEFSRHVADTLTDARGWSMGGSVQFTEVASGGDFTLWLSQASMMTTFSSGCDAYFSCRVGRDVIINDDRWSYGGAPDLKMGLDDYRHMVVGHEVGHWLGFDHHPCIGDGQAAYIMQQQSKGQSAMGGCFPHPWPRPEERVAAADYLGVKLVQLPRLGMSATPSSAGYWIVQADGRVYARGDAKDLGGMAGKTLNRPLVGMAATPTGAGYWLVGDDGGIFSFGDAKFFGSTGNIKLNRPVVGMTSTPSGKGYWFVATDGGIFAYGDAKFFGSTGSMKLNQPIVGMASSPTGNGYWLVASDGGVFAYGDAKFYGSTGAIKLAKPVVGMTSTPTGKGYWFVASDGGIFAYGDAKFQGSIGGTKLLYPVKGMASTKTGQGYWMLAADGLVFNSGDAQFFGNGF